NLPTFEHGAAGLVIIIERNATPVPFLLHEVPDSAFVKSDLYPLDETNTENNFASEGYIDFLARNTPSGPIVEVDTGPAAFTFKGGVHNLPPQIPAGSFGIPVPYPNLYSVPGTFGIPNTGLAYHIFTDASYGEPVNVCFRVPNINNFSMFNVLRAVRNELGAQSDRTISNDFDRRRICAEVDSLTDPSPQTQQASASMATENGPSIGGQIMVGNAPLAGIPILLTGGPDPLVAYPDARGFYVFSNLDSSSRYTLAPFSVSHVFTPATALVTNPSANQTVYFAAVPSPPNIVRLAQT